MNPKKELKKKESVQSESEEGGRRRSLKKKYRDLDQYKSFFFINDTPAPDKFLDQLAEDLIDWARQEDSLKFILFLDEVGVNDNQFRNWMKRHEKLRMAHEWAIRLLGARREIGAIKGKYREKPIMHTMHQYDPEWKLADEFHFTKQREANTPEYVEVRYNQITVEKKGANE